MCAATSAQVVCGGRTTAHAPRAPHARSCSLPTLYSTSSPSRSMLPSLMACTWQNTSSEPSPGLMKPKPRPSFQRRAVPLTQPASPPPPGLRLRLRPRGGLRPRRGGERLRRGGELCTHHRCHGVWPGRRSPVGARRRNEPRSAARVTKLESGQSGLVRHDNIHFFGQSTST
jgi:hypothetical protein